MVWVKHDDQFSSHPKVRRLSDKAYRLHMCAIEHCARFLTDGLVSVESLEDVSFAAKVSSPKRYVDELVAAKLWIVRNASTWRIHDFLKYNRSKEQVEAERKEAAYRQKRYRDRNAVSNGVTNDVSNRVSNKPLGRDGYRQTKKESGLAFDVNEAAERWLLGLGWDESFDKEAITEEIERISRRGGAEGRLDLGSLLKLWREIRHERYGLKEAS